MEEQRISMLEKEVADLKQQFKERKFLRGVTFEDMMLEAEKGGISLSYGDAVLKPTLKVQIKANLRTLDYVDEMIEKLHNQYGDKYNLHCEVVF